MVAVERGHRHGVASDGSGSSVETSPSGRPSSRARSRRRTILPLSGSSGSRRRTRPRAARPPRRAVRGRGRAARARSASSASTAGRERHERLDDLPGDRVGHADHARLGDRRVLEQRALDLERPDQVAGRLDDVVAAPDEPEVAVVVAAREVAGAGTSRRRSSARSARARRGSRGTSTASRGRSASSPCSPSSAWTGCPSAPMTTSPSSSRRRIAASIPGSGRPIEPGRTSIAR